MATLTPPARKVKPSGIDGVVGNAERGDFDIADGEALAGLDELDAFEALGMRLGKNVQRFGVGFRGDVDGGAPRGQQRAKAADMVGMFVGDDDAVEPVDGAFDGGEAPEGFFFAQAGVHQKAGLGSLEQRAVAGAARGQDAHAKADAIPPNRSRGAIEGMRDGGIIAEGGESVNGFQRRTCGIRLGEGPKAQERFFTAWRPSRRSGTREKAGRHSVQNDAAGVLAAGTAHHCRRSANRRTGA